jgi:hypothetical protein
MKKVIRLGFPVAVLLAVANARQVNGQSNLPPQVSILWPTMSCPAFYNSLLNPGTVIKIKASAMDPDGLITQVQFFANTNLIGVVSNAPFSAIWKVPGPTGSQLILKAVAVDNLGATAESPPIQVSVIDFPMPPVFEITAPPNGSALAAPGMFIFNAELLASPLRDTGSVEFFVGANSVGIVMQTGPFTNTTPVYSLTVTNIPEGDYGLRVRKDNFSTGYFASGSCQPPVIRVTKLGMQLPRLTPDSKFEFDVVTSFPSNQTIIQASSNLINWVPISTNVPLSNTFTFTEPSPATNSPRFYRAVVPSQ